MSIKLMSMVFEAAGLTSTQKLVLLALADYAADDGTSIYPSVETMSHKTALKKHTIHQTLSKLRSDEIGLIRITEKYTSRRPNRYQIDVMKLSRLSPNDTQKARVLPDNTLSITTEHPRVSLHDTDPSLTINEPPASVTKSRERDLLFDAIVEVTGVDPKTTGSSIAKVCEVLKKVDPPYTPDEIRAYGVDWWSWKERTKPPSLWKLKEEIGLVRSNGSRQHASDESIRGRKVYQ